MFGWANEEFTMAFRLLWPLPPSSLFLSAYTCTHTHAHLEKLFFIHQVIFHTSGHHFSVSYLICSSSFIWDLMLQWHHREGSGQASELVMWSHWLNFARVNQAYYTITCEHAWGFVNISRKHWQPWKRWFSLILKIIKKKKIIIKNNVWFGECIHGFIFNSVL